MLLELIYMTYHGSFPLTSIVLGVPFTVLLTFNRLKQLSTDVEVVAAALKKSTAVEVRSV